MSAAPDRVAIVLVNWNGWRDCIECLSSIYGSDAPALADVWLVDNDSGDGSVERIEQWCRQPQADPGWRAHVGVRHVGSLPATAPIACRVWQANGQPAPEVRGRCLNIVRSGGNLGFAGGNNVGMVAAGLDRYSHFWLLNTDTVMRHDALHQLLARAGRDPGLGLVGSSLIYYSQPERLQAQGGGRLDLANVSALHIGEGRPVQSPSGDAELMAVEAQMAYVVGASMLVSAGFIRDIGLMCEDYFLYFEELDWAFRARGRYGMGYAPGSWVFHKVGGSSAKPQSEFSLNLLYRNQLRFTGRFLPERLGAVQRKLFVELLREALKGHWTAVRLLVGALRDRHELAAGGGVASPGP